jgi:acetylornithine deacetylase
MTRPRRFLGAATAEGVARRAPPFGGRAGAPYWMASAMWETAGAPTIVCGPAGDGLHTAVERVKLTQVRAHEEALTALIPAFARRC